MENNQNYISGKESPKGTSKGKYTKSGLSIGIRPTAPGGAAGR